jgi:hypothetical protein
LSLVPTNSLWKYVRGQSGKLFGTLYVFGRLQNQLVADRVLNLAACKGLKTGNLKPKFLDCAGQYKSVSAYTKANPEWAKHHSLVLQNLLVRVDEDYERLCETVNADRSNSSHPKHKDEKKYKSFTFPQYGSAHSKRNIHL